ncbi:MAG: outer membrane beta-barrel protein [Minwuia sp.]|nr:outer membrane beta-barrel protein [Minwuia sp.]
MCVASLALAAFSAPSQAELSGPYLSAGVLGTSPRDSDVTGANVGDLELNLGLGGLVAAGYQFESGFRLEGEISFRHNGGDSFNNAATSGDLSSLAGMGNLIWEYDNSSGIYPYIGAGMGLAYLSATDINLGAQTLDDSDYTMAYQGLAGVAFAVTPNLSMTAEYRYFFTEDADFVNSANGNLTSSYSNHTAMLGLRYRFGSSPQRLEQAEAKPVVRPIARAVEPRPRRLAPPPATRAVAQTLPASQAQAAMQLRQTYVVFFATDSATLSPESRGIVAQASTQAKADKAKLIELTGHTDRAGPAAYNLRLSQRRAENTAVELRNSGVTAEMKLYAKGETQPEVPTADGVANQRNRRVEIVVQGDGDGMLKPQN